MNLNNNSFKICYRNSYIILPYSHEAVSSHSLGKIMTPAPTVNHVCNCYNFLPLSKQGLKSNSLTGYNNSYDLEKMNLSQPLFGKVCNLYTNHADSMSLCER